MMLCSTDNPYYLIFSDKIPSLVYYSHIPICILSLFIGVYFFLKDRNNLINQIILLITMIFSSWVFLDLIFWASNRSDIIMFVWSLQILIEPIVHIGGFYLIYVLLNKKDLSFKQKVVIVLIYLPIIILLPTDYILTSFDLKTCLSQESKYSYYSYIIEIFFTLCVIYTGINNFIKEKNLIEKNKIILLTTSTTILLLSFSWGAIIGSFTENWNLAQFGLFGMPIFLSILIFTIIKFNILEFKIIGKNALVVGLWILIASLLAINDVYTGRIIVIITLIISIFFGIVLIKLAKKEVEQMEKISLLAKNLEISNLLLSNKVTEQTQQIQTSYSLEMKAHRELKKLGETKDQFITLAQHNLRIPINNITNRLKNIISNNQKEIDPNILRDIDGALQSSENLRHIADDLKDIAKIKIGSQILNTTETSILPIIEKVLNELKIDIDKLSLNITYPTNKDSWPYINIDSNKIQDVLMVILENAVKYNKYGGKIEIDTKLNDDKFELQIFNTGVGITDKEREDIFSRSFYRGKRAQEINPTGMGIGLTLSRSIIEAHHGKLTIHSDGEDMGVKVIINMPYDFLKNILL